MTAINQRTLLFSQKVFKNLTNKNNQQPAIWWSDSWIKIKTSKYTDYNDLHRTKPIC